MIYTTEQVIQIIGASMAVRDAITKEMDGKIPPISLTKARELYGYANVERWRKDGIIHPKRNGTNKNSTLLFTLSDLERANQAEKLSIRLTNGY